MTRAYFHYTKAEEFQPEGMWRILHNPGDRQRYIDASADLMRHPDAFLAAMLRAITEWPNSCRANLSAASMNHQAWFGHAGCFLATGSPEDCTRLGWHTLNQAEQDAANHAADQAIQEWRITQARMPGQLELFGDSDA